MSFNRSDLEYTLPPERIAQKPARPRDASRVLVVDRGTDVFDELPFRALPDRIGAQDLMVVNDTRVVPARLRGRKASGGAAEVLLLERRADGEWLALVRVSGRVRPGLELVFDGAAAEVTRVLEHGRFALRFRGEIAEDALLEKLGELPLPPYVERAHVLDSDAVDYQTIFATEPGAVAAPTASLHFTAAVAERLRIARITLHVGPGTFRPIKTASLDDHVIASERFDVPQATADAIAHTRAAGGNVIAVGTTVVRALETTGGEAGTGTTELFVKPGDRFRVVDQLVTNFHLPGSTLLALVMAFAGVERTRNAYAYAIENAFRFYSYGDAMWIR